MELPQQEAGRREKVLIADLGASVYCVRNCTEGRQKESSEIRHSL